MNFEKQPNYRENDINQEIKTRNKAIDYLKELKSRLSKDNLDERIESKDEERREELKKLITYKSSLKEDREENIRILTEIDTMINFFKESIVDKVKKEDEFVQKDIEQEFKEAA